ncbi:MAG: diguanylate cyclase, partial [Chromatiaceae bacterium]|nr:diguanylate cyclase [Chromatiaceae bacterium]
HHQDPDITASLPLIDAMNARPDALLVTHWRTRALLRHYGLEMPFWLVEEHDWRLSLEDRELRFVFTPYAHFPGAICTFDPASSVLFSSDLFGGFTERPTLVAQDESHFEALRPFHEHYMPSRDILDYALCQIEQHPVRCIAPQHGSLIPEPLVGFMIDKLRHLDCGIYLYASEDTDIRRLSQLNQTLREITQTMLLYRDFRDIAERLQDVVRHNLPVRQIDYHVPLDNGEVLSLTQETRFSGVRDLANPCVREALGRTLAECEALFRTQPGFLVRSLAGGLACVHRDADGRVLSLPLLSPQTERVSALAVLHLEAAIELNAQEQHIIAQIMLPLQVALEREAIHRSIEAERARSYQRSIRDPLTGLFNRVYMQDAMERQCQLQDRDQALQLAAIMLDVDHFKSINDTYGHAAGDAVLRQVASLLTAGIRESDIPVRFGGEEFILFLMSASNFSVDSLAERLRAAIAAHSFQLDEGEALHVTASLGVAVRHSGEPLDRLIRRADEALYRAKQGGRNRCEIASG